MQRSTGRACPHIQTIIMSCLTMLQLEFFFASGQYKHCVSNMVKHHKLLLFALTALKIDSYASSSEAVLQRSRTLSSILKVEIFVLQNKSKNCYQIMSIKLFTNMGNTTLLASSICCSDGIPTHHFVLLRAPFRHNHNMNGRSHSTGVMLLLRDVFLNPYSTRVFLNVTSYCEDERLCPLCSFAFTFQ